MAKFLSFDIHALIAPKILVAQPAGVRLRGGGLPVFGAAAAEGERYGGADSWVMSISVMRRVAVAVALPTARKATDD